MYFSIFKNLQNYYIYIVALTKSIKESSSQYWYCLKVFVTEVERYLIHYYIYIIFIYISTNSFRQYDKEHN